MTTCVGPHCVGRLLILLSLLGLAELVPPVAAASLVPPVRRAPVKTKGAFTPFLVLKNPHGVPVNWALTNVVLVAVHDADLWQSFISPRAGWHWAGFLGAGQRLEIPIEADQAQRFFRLIYSYPQWDGERWSR